MSRIRSIQVSPLARTVSELDRNLILKTTTYDWKDSVKLAEKSISITNYSSKTTKPKIELNRKTNNKIINSKFVQFWEGVETVATISSNTNNNQNIQQNKNNESNSKTKHSRYVIYPEAEWKLIWNLLMITLIMYCMIVIPFQIAFLSNESVVSLNVIDYIIDVIFLIDIILTFNTGYVDQDTEVMISNHKDIALRYLKFWFWLDIISIIPFNIFLNHLNNHSKFKILLLLRFTRLLRLAKYFSKVEWGNLGSRTKWIEKIFMNTPMLKVFKLAFQILLTAHLVACTWYFLSSRAITTLLGEGSEFRTWVDVFGYEATTHLDKYVVSLYWAIATLFTVGYGDIHPVNDQERLFASLTMLGGSVLMGAVIARVTKVISTYNVHGRAFKEKLDEIKAYLAERMLPRHLKIKALEAYTYYLQKKSVFNESEIFALLPSDMFIKLIKSAYSNEIRNINLLRDTTASFAVEMISQGTPFQLRKGEIILHMGDHTSDIIFLLKGLVQMKRKEGKCNSIIGYISKGDHFGDLEFMLKSTSLCTYVAATHCMFISVPFKHLSESLKNHPKVASYFKKLCQDRYDNFKYVMNSSEVNISISSPRSSIHEGTLFNLLSPKNTSTKNRQTTFSNGPDNAFVSTKLKDAVTKSHIYFDGNVMQYSQVEENVEDRLNSSSNIYQVIMISKITNREETKDMTLQQIWNDYRIIHPNMKLKSYWDVLIIILIVYSVVMAPIEVAFNNSIQTTLSPFEWTVDGLFVIDLILSFRLSYFNSESDSWMLIDKTIIERYLKSWFLIDLLSSIPYDLLINSSVTSIKLLKTLRFVRMLKLLRAAKLAILINSIENRLGISPTFFELLKMMIGVVLFAHYIACCWWGITVNLTTYGWMDNRAMVYEDLLNAHLGVQYLASFYWTITTITTTGYGDITSVNTFERIVNIIVMIFGATLFGYITGSMAALMGSINRSKSAFGDKLDEMKEYLIEKNIADKLSNTVVKVIENKLKESSAFDEQAIFSRLPQHVRTKIFIINYEQILNKIPIFKYISNHTIRLFLFNMMTSEYFGKGNYLMREGLPANSIMFIVHGTADIYKRKKVKTSSKAMIASTNKNISELVRQKSRNVLQAVDEKDSSSDSSQSDIDDAPIKSSRRRSSLGDLVMPFMRRLSTAHTSNQVQIKSISSNDANDDIDGNIVGELGVGSFIGHVSMIKRSNCDVSVKARTSCRVYKLSKKSILELIRDYPSEAFILQRALGKASEALNYKLSRTQIKNNRKVFYKDIKQKYILAKAFSKPVSRTASTLGNVLNSRLKNSKLFKSQSSQRTISDDSTNNPNKKSGWATLRNNRSKLQALKENIQMNVEMKVLDFDEHIPHNDLNQSPYKVSIKSADSSNEIVYSNESNRNRNATKSFNDISEVNTKPHSYSISSDDGSSYRLIDNDLKLYSAPESATNSNENLIYNNEAKDILNDVSESSQKLSNNPVSIKSNISSTLNSKNNSTKFSPNGSPSTHSSFTSPVYKLLSNSFIKSSNRSTLGSKENSVNSLSKQNTHLLTIFNRSSSSKVSKFNKLTKLDRMLAETSTDYDSDDDLPFQHEVTKRSLDTLAIPPASNLIFSEMNGLKHNRRLSYPSIDIKQWKHDRLKESMS